MKFQETGYAIKKTQQVIHTVMDKKLRTVSLTLPQYSVLKVLEDHGPMTGAKLAKDSFVTPQTMHTLLISMEKRGLVSRSPEAGSSKSLSIAITNTGLNLLVEAEKALRSVIKKGSQILTTEEHTQLMHLLERLRGGIIS